jgi:hypothetical protein
VLLDAAHLDSESPCQSQTLDVHRIDDATDALGDRTVIWPVFTAFGPRQIAKHDAHMGGRIEVAEHDRKNVLTLLEPVSEQRSANH